MQHHAKIIWISYQQQKKADAYRRPPFYRVSQDDADESTAALIDDTGQRLLQLLSSVLRHPLQLGL